MANISQKPPSGNPGGKPGQKDRFILEGAEEIYLPSAEPMTILPNVDVYSSATELVIELEMPGVRKEDIEVTLQKGTLTVKGLKYECFDNYKVNYVCLERVFGRMYRAIDIPFAVDTGRIKAALANGILKITIPRVEDKRSKKKLITIEGA